MTVIEQFYASGGSDVKIATLELSCPAWEKPVYLCKAYEDLMAATETGEVVTYQACGMDVALPKRDNSGNQTLNFAIDNVTGESQQLIDEALDTRQVISLVFRVYLSSDLSAPAEKPYRMKVKGGYIQGVTSQLSSGYYDLLNLAWPRRKYTLDFAPGLRYV